MTATLAEAPPERTSRTDTATIVRRRSRLDGPMPTDRLVGWLGPLAVALAAFLMRINRLSVPGAVVFDETYYRKDACDLIRYGVERSGGICDVIVNKKASSSPGSGFVVHPPLGKWLIGLGEWLWPWRHGPIGADATASRIMGVIAGSIAVLVLCRLGRRMFRSTLIGCFAGLLMSLDGLHFVQSRTAMVDIFLLMFVVCAAACLVADRDQQRARLAERLTGDLTYPGPKLGMRWWLVGAGVCLGAACAVKWSGLYFIVAFGLLAFAWGVGARRTAGIPAPFRSALWRDSLQLVGWLLLVPAVVYVSSWAGWFATNDGWRRDCNHKVNAVNAKWCGPYHGFLEYHLETFRFHRDLRASHPVKDHKASPHTYQSDPWRWLLLQRPVAYFYSSPKVPSAATVKPDDPDRSCHDASRGCSKEILGIGTPFIWWASILALFALMWRWISHRDWRASFILVTFALGYLTWAYPPYRTAFQFYALPILPFLCLAIAMCAGWALGGRGASLLRKQIAIGAIGLYAFAVIWNFNHLYPILSAKVIPYTEWQDRMWLDSSWI